MSGRCPVASKTVTTARFFRYKRDVYNTLLLHNIILKVIYNKIKALIKPDSIPISSESLSAPTVIFSYSEIGLFLTHCKAVELSHFRTEQTPLSSYSNK